MENVKTPVGKIIPLCLLRIKFTTRRLRSIPGLLAGMFVILYLLFLGVVLVFLFLVGEPTISDPYRNYLAFCFLTLLGTGLSYLVAAGATGLRNPYITRRQDVRFYQQVPVEPSVIYLSARLAGLLIYSLLIILIIWIVFGPLMLVLDLPWWRIAGVQIACILTFNLCGNLADLAFFTLERFRRKGRWDLVWLDTSSPVQFVIFLAVPALAYVVYLQGLIPSFETLSRYTLLPLVNGTIAATGFFFRSGVPLESWIALVLLLVESILLAIVTAVIAANYQPMEDMTEIMPVLSFLETKAQDLTGGKAIEPPELVSEDIEGKAIFTGKSPWSAHVLKDLLAIMRIRVLRRRIYLAPLIVGIITILILFIVPRDDPLFYMILILSVFQMAEFPLLLAQLEVKDPMQRFPVDRWVMGKSKIFLALLGAGFYGIPLLVAKGLVSLVIIVLVAGLGVIIGKTKWGSFRTRYLLLVAITLSTTPLLVWG
ncbi:MAG: hypothetical protein ACXAEU_13330 [Candidatus Hodarchaeales archaeon]|jgi:hypothetical protein